MSLKDEELLFLKQKVYDQVIQRYLELITRLENSVRELQLSANEETKSSVGDKYETGRAMAQNEIEKLSHQLREHSKARGVIEAAKPIAIVNSAQLGSMVETSIGDFYLINNSGEFDVQGRKIISISLQSPLGQNLFGKKAGDEFVQNGRPILIKKIF